MKQEKVLRDAGIKPVRRQFPLPKTGWGNFPSATIPIYFNEGMAYNYMVERHPTDYFATTGSAPDSALDKGTFHIRKPDVRALQYVKSGYVFDIEDCSNEEVYFVKCKIHASYRKEFHKTSAVISNKSGFVLYANCNCFAGALGRCSHVATLLRCLWEFNVRNAGEERCDPLCNRLFNNF